MFRDPSIVSFFKVGNVRFGPFHIFIYVIQWYRSASQLYCTMWLHWSDVNAVLKHKWCAVILNVIFLKVREVKFGPLWSICTNISETVHVTTKVYMKQINMVIYDNICPFRMICHYFNVIWKKNLCYQHNYKYTSSTIHCSFRGHIINTMLT